MNSSLQDDSLLQWEAILTGLRGNETARRRAITLLFELVGGRIVDFMGHRVIANQADDLMQEVFIRVLKKIETFAGEVVAFRAWVWKIAAHVRIDALRKAGIRVEDPQETEVLESIADDSATSRPECEIERSSFRACVQLGFKRYAQDFPERAKWLRLICLEEFKIETIAELLGRSEGATRTYLWECRKKMRAYLEHCRELIEV